MNILTKSYYAARSGYRTIYSLCVLTACLVPHRGQRVYHVYSTTPQIMVCGEYESLPQQYLSLKWTILGNIFLVYVINPIKWIYLGVYTLLCIQEKG